MEIIITEDDARKGAFLTTDDIVEALDDTGAYIIIMDEDESVYFGEVIVCQELKFDRHTGDYLPNIGAYLVLVDNENIGRFCFKSRRSFAVCAARVNRFLHKKHKTPPADSDGVQTKK